MIHDVPSSGSSSPNIVIRDPLIGTTNFLLRILDSLDSLIVFHKIHIQELVEWI